MESKIKHIIFLDIDGVCNSDDWYYRSRILKNTKNDGDFDPRAVQLLNLIEGGEVVICSSWGIDADSPLKAHGLKLPIIGHVDLKPYYDAEWICRGNCISKWLLDNNYIVSKFGNHSIENGYNYVIFDDDVDMLMSQHGNFIHIDRRFGLQMSDIDKAKKILQLHDNSN